MRRILTYISGQFGISNEMESAAEFKSNSAKIQIFLSVKQNYLFKSIGWQLLKKLSTQIKAQCILENQNTFALSFIIYVYTVESDDTSKTAENMVEKAPIEPK